MSEPRNGTMYLAFPLGTVHGWGVCGRMITREMAQLAPVEFYTQELQRELVVDDLEYRFLVSLLPPGTDPMKPPPGHPVDGPVLRGIPAMHISFRPALRGPFNVGYTFFEEAVPKDRSKTTFGEFDHLVAGSTWCADALREAGFPSVSVILQGVEPRIFNPTLNEKEFFRDRFVIFSGGKLEFRKGQDLVIRAFAILQQRHKDVMLINAWFNLWTWNAATISASKHIQVPALQGDHVSVVNQLMAHNGIDISSVITLGPRANPLMAGIYKNTDIGLFPNRCEGGTNLVMMEYMACGKPVIGALHTGHKDILTEANSLPLRAANPIPVIDEKKNNVGTWYEPDLDEIVEKLEWAYQNRDELKPLAQRGGEDLAKMTWSSTAKQFFDLLTRA
jgi:glycosyltransferase involved in cell wall biosynthesis